jgi:hypothetical protein
MALVCFNNPEPKLVPAIDSGEEWWGKHLFGATSLHHRECGPAWMRFPVEDD